MLIAKNVAVVRGQFLVVLAESLADGQLPEKPEGRPPAFAAVVNRWADKVGRMLLDSGIGKFV